MKPILTSHLFPELESKLLDLLRSLTPQEWEAQTVAPAWKVRDVAAHLLDTQLRKLSMGRDQILRTPLPVIRSNDDLVAYINRLNREGVEMYRRLSPPVLISMMEVASQQMAEYVGSLETAEYVHRSIRWLKRKSA